MVYSKIEVLAVLLVYRHWKSKRENYAIFRCNPSDLREYMQI